LRAVQCPADIADQIGGWATDGVGQGYGSGYPIEVLEVWLKKMHTKLTLNGKHLGPTT